jgi:predicted HicB family RNase H-like nuclease
MDEKVRRLPGGKQAKIKEELWSALKQIAAKKGVTLNDVIEAALAKYAGQMLGSSKARA